MALERIEVAGPEPAEGGEPGIHFLQRFGIEAINAALRVHGRVDETRLAQHAEMLGYGRLRHAQLALDLADRLFRRDEQAEDRAAVRLRDDVEDGFHEFYIPHEEYARQGIYASAAIRRYDRAAAFRSRPLMLRL